MLDTAHRLTLRAVDAGTAGDSPALRRLVRSGLVSQGAASGAYEVTAAGRVAMEGGKPRSRVERWALGSLAFAGGLYVVATLGERLFG